MITGKKRGFFQQGKASRSACQTDMDAERSRPKLDTQMVKAELAAALEAETSAINEGDEDVRANNRASAEQMVLSHEIAAAYIETGTGANDADDLHRRLRDDLIPNRPHGLMVRMRPARLAHRMPMLSDLSFQGVQGDEVNVHIPVPQLKAAEVKICEVIKAMRRQGEEMFREEAVTRLRKQFSPKI